LDQSKLLLNKVNVNLNMLGPSMLHKIVGHVHNWKIVTVYNSSLLNAGLQLGEQPAQPNRLCHSVCNHSITSLCIRARNRNLPFGRPQNQIVTKKTQYPDVDRRVSRQPALSTSEYVVKIVWDDKFMWRPWSKVPLRYLRIRLTWLWCETRGVMHVEAGLLDNIRKFRSSKSELLKCTCETTIESWVRKWLTVKGEFRSGVNRSSRGLKILHASARTNINNLLSLGKKQTTRGTSDRNTQEMMKNTQGQSWRILW
jgi:hypothetical protein